MATEREEIRHEGGRGGKFQKRPLRRSNTTPYDRPPTALRNPNWLSKLVDPAQKLITSSAHMLFSSVFRKRLPPPPAPLPVSPEANDEMGNENQGEIAANPPVTQEGTDLDFVPSIKSDNTHGVTDLEQILKEKTFTRSEIDRLTELLKSRVSDVPSGVEERNFEQVPSTPVISHGIHEVSLKFPAQDGVTSHAVPTNVMSTNVLDEDVASPAEIAKAYMGSRPPKSTPFSMGSHSIKFGDSFTSGDPSKSSTLSLVPRSPGKFDATENGFVTPRSRGRSALYSMPRMPYSRVSATPSIKNSVATIDAYRATGSSSQSGWEKERFLGSKKGTLKRRSSVLDDEMGSVGPIRRTRQKSTLLYPKGLSLPSSSTSIPVSGFGSETSQHFQSTKVHPFSSSVGKALYSSDTKRSSFKMSAKSKNDVKPSSSFRQIPLRSSEMASKILEQLEKMTPPKEKSLDLKLRNNSPMKLSSSMLHGPALRSLEDVIPSKYLENVEDIRSNDVRDLTSQKNDKVEESSSLKFKVPYDKSISAGDGVGSSVPTKDAVPSSSMHVSSVGPSSQTKSAFQLSAHEDFVDVDEGYSNGPVTDISFERRVKVDGSLVAVSKPSDAEAIIVDKPQASSEIKPSTVSEMNNINDQGKVNIPVTAEKSPIFSFAKSPESALTPEKTVSSEAPKAATASIFGFGDKFPSQKESISSAPTFAFGNKVSPSRNEQNDVPVAISESNVSPSQQASVPTIFKFGDKAAFSIPANAATENGNKNAGSPIKLASPLVNEKESAKVGRASVFKAESFSSSNPSFGVAKESMSDKGGDKRSSTGLTVGTSENLLLSSVSTPTPTPTPTPTTSLFSFSSPSTNSNLNNGSLVSTPSIFSSPATAFSNSFTNQNSSIEPSLTAAPSNSEPATTAPIFKFGSPSVPSTSAPALSAPSAVGFVETKAKQETTVGNLSGVRPSDTSAAKVSSTVSSVFQFGAAATMDSNKQPEHSSFAPGSAPAFGGPVLPASSGVVSSTQSTPVFSCSSSSTPFGLAGNTGSSSGSSLFASSAPASNLFSSGMAFGFSSSSSANNSVSSSAGTSSSLFNSQSSSAPLFSTGFSSTPTGGFSFGLSSSSAASNSAPALFGSSSMFSFTSAATAASSQPAIGNSNHGFTFNSTPPANNDQSNMEDSMAEDTVQAVAPSTPTFGQQPFTPPPSSGFAFGSTAPSPSPGFAFGSTAPSPSPGFAFGSTAPSSLPGFAFGSTAPPPLAASPFQFGGQQNMPTPQNASPFQASGSLDLHASGGSFSLGTGGGDKSKRRIVKVKRKK